MNWSVTKILWGTAAVLLIAGAAMAEETKIRTEVHTKVQDLPNVKKVNFSAFDTNGDGKYSMEEVGTRLFESFDLDDNESIDNQEWSERAVMTITPIEQETFEFVDVGNDGDTDYTNYTYQTFYKESGLMKFDENKNGLSAKEFIGKGFEALDTDQDKLISKDEWQAAYMEGRLSPASSKKYN